MNIDTQAYPEYVKSVPSILINNQVISGQTVFEYFGKLVEAKKTQEERVENNQANDSDEGQCRINEDGELEGWCGSGVGVEYSMITEDNDDYTKKTYKMETNYDLLEGDDSIGGQVESMESKDAMISQKKKSFDSDLERMQRERGEMMGQGGPGQGGPGQGGPGQGGPGQGGPGQGMMGRR